MLRPWFYFSWIHPKTSRAVDGQGLKCGFVKLHSMWYRPLSPSLPIACRLDLLLSQPDRLGHTLKKLQVTNMNQVVFPSPKPLKKKYAGSNFKIYFKNPAEVWGVWVRCNRPTCGVSLIPASSGTPRTPLAFDLATMVLRLTLRADIKELAFPCSVSYRTQ